MKKLTEAQKRVIEKAKKDIKLAKECKTFKEYYVRLITDDFRKRPDYKDIVSREIERFENHYEDVAETYLQWYEKERNENIVLTMASTNTLKALEKMGYIKIIKAVNGSYSVDTIQLLKENIEA